MKLKLSLLLTVLLTMGSFFIATIPTTYAETSSQTSTQKHTKHKKHKKAKKSAVKTKEQKNKETH